MRLIPGSFLWSNAYAKSATLINMTVRFGSFARRICQPRRATLEATALIRESVPDSTLEDNVQLLDAYSIPTAKTSEIPIFRLRGICKFHTAMSGMMSMTTSDSTLIMDAVTRRE